MMMYNLSMKNEVYKSVIRLFRLNRHKMDRLSKWLENRKAKSNI